MVFLHIWLKHPLLYSKDERLPSRFLASYFNTLFANVTNNLAALLASTFAGIYFNSSPHM